MAERMRGVKALWAGQERRVALWMPTGIALGILLRLGEVAPVLALSAGFLLVLLILRMPGLLLMLTVAGGLASMALGALAMDLRLRTVAAPVLSEPLERRITGQLLAIDRTRAGLPRALLGEVSIDGLDPSATPRRARIAFLAAPELPELGTRIAVVARLSPPPGPAEPGGFDFSRQAFFAGLGAVGYTRETPAIVGGVESGGGWTLRIDRLRREIAIALRAQVGGAEGAVAAAITVGDRSGLTPETVAALRDSGLAHLLAISGLHVGLLSALVYTGLRLALSLHPVASEAWPSRKIAALAGMLAAGAYLLLAGAGVATQRAFVMASVAFFAVLIDRPAVTLRALAMAGVVILLVRPESLFSAGFQMSFGAVTALVAGYEATRGMWRGRAARHGWRSRLTTVALATVMTSALAGMATAPFAAFHFNRLVLYGFIANLAATPLMGIWIMPCIIAAALLAPFGLEWIALAALEQGLAVILRIADLAATPEDAVIGIPASSDLRLILMVTGGLWVAVWRGYLRLAGFLPIAISLLFWTSAVPRPELLISEDAGLVGGRSADGQLWVSRERRDVFSAETWLRRDGEMPPDPLRAHARRDWSCDRATCSGTTGRGWRVVLLRNNRMTSALDCEAPTLVILPGHISRRSRDRIGQDCVQIDLARFAGASSIAVFLRQHDEPEIRAAYPWHLRGRRDQ